MTKQESFMKEFFPNYFIFESSEITKEMVKLKFVTKKRTVICPHCHKPTTEYVTYYTRNVQDLSILDRATFISIKFRKMKCENSDCNIKYFNEPLDEFVSVKKRYTNRLINLITKVALTNTAEGGSRILKEHNISVSGDKLLQLVKNYEHKIDKKKVTAIGVDDFALKKNIHMELFL